MPYCMPDGGQGQLRYAAICLAKPVEFLDIANSRFVNRRDSSIGERRTIIHTRSILLELWAMLVLAGVVGFMGPFGTFGDEGLVDRVVHWWQLLMGAYLLVRPAIFGLARLARATQLPLKATMFWGVVVVSLPLAAIWRSIGQDEFRELDGFTGLLPFSLLCSLAVLGVTRWAASADRQLSDRDLGSPPESNPAQSEQSDPDELATSTAPSLKSRLAPTFQGPILALQSEDHYVRVHGKKDSELVLVRLREAIAEMDGVNGEQVHRSWWVARDAIAKVEPSGRSWKIVLKNGVTVPVARDSVSRLQEEGLIPGVLSSVDGPCTARGKLS